MATDIVRAYKDGILAYQFDPTRMQGLGIQLIRDSSDGLIDIVDCTNPMVALMEACACTVSAGLEKMEVLNRRDYAIAAQTIEDLYPHMSDKDYTDRFATPSTTVFNILISMDELNNSLVLDPATNTKKLVIPPHTNFTIANTTFSIQYPVVISLLQHGGYSVLYDVSNPSPLQTLESNYIPWEPRRDGNNQDFMFFQLDVQQFNIVSEQSDINEAQETKLNVAFTDQYYYARVYHGSAETGWNEIQSTHTDQIYDITTPTAVLQVLEGILAVRIPQIYVNTGQLSQKIRVDVYQTKGPLSLNMVDYSMDACVTNFLVLDKSEDSAFTAPLKSMRQFHAFSPTTTSGGTDALSFEDLRERVINNTMGLGNRVITNVELPVALEAQGYEVVANVDNLTNRDFLATKPMPTPSNKKLITPAAASIETLALTVENLLSYSGVINNGTSITLTPDLLYKSNGGSISPVSDSALKSLLALSAEQRALAVTNGGYYYTPFHYVMDMTGATFELRPYYLEAPSVTAKIFVAENDTTLLQVSTQAYVIEKIDTGYRLSIVTQSSDDFKDLQDDEVFVQLAFVPDGEKDRAYINGTLVNKDASGERVYVFDLSSNMNVDAANNLELTEFFMYTTEPRITAAPLTTTFDVIFSTTAVMRDTYKPSAIDSSLGNFLLPSSVTGVTHEQLKIKFGDVLDKLWASARTVTEAAQYQTYDVDIVETYQNDVYERGANGEMVQIIDDKVVMNKLHAKGDPVLDGNGEPVVKFKKGDIVLDANQQPIPVGTASLARQMDLLMVEGAYWFATDAAAVSYRTELTDTLVSWLTQDLEQLSKRLLEQTRLFFYPKVNMGYIDVMLADGTVISMQAGQALRVDLVISSAVNSNATLKERLKTTTVQALSNWFTGTTVAVDEAQDEMRDLYAGDVISCTVSGLGGASNYPMLTVVDDANRLSLRKRLVAQTDDTLIVEEDVTINFIVHEKK